MRQRAVISNEQSFVPAERIEQLILFIRGEKVMRDSDLAAMYQVETRTLVQAVRRSFSRFPADFMFQLSKEEFEALKSQIVISNKGRGADVISRMSLPSRVSQCCRAF